MNPAEASARAVDELTDVALPHLPMTDVDRVEAAILADCAEAERTIQRLIAQADAYGRRVAELEAEMERRSEVVRRFIKSEGPYQIGRWTDEIVHTDPCDCDLDEEEAGDRCMDASEWTYGVFVDGGAFAPRLITKLPRRPPEQSDDDTPPDWFRGGLSRVAP